MTTNVNGDLLWHYSDFIVVDLEGTGAQHKDREGIVEIAAIKIHKQKLTDDYFYRIINPEISIPPMISRIHGLKDADVEIYPKFSEIGNDLLEFINERILVGHNVNVDYKLLRRKLASYSPALMLDTQIIAKYLWPNTKYSLDDLIERFSIQPLLLDLPVKRGRHSAFYDAYATGLVFLKILEENFPTALLKEIAAICGTNIDQTLLF